MKLLSRLILLCIIVISLPVHAQQLVEGIVAIVGKEIILKSEVDQHVQNYAIQNRINLNDNPAIIEDLRKQTLDYLIEQKILLAKAEEDTLTVDDTMLEQRVNERIRYLIDQVGSESKLEEIFGGPIKDIRKNTRKVLREQMLVEQARSMKFRNISVSRREVEQFYKSYKDSLPGLQETVDISHILKVVEPSQGALLSAYQKAEKILERIKNGENFEKLAKEFSEDPASAKRGGDLGLISRGDFVTEYETAAFNLKEDEISDIVQTQFGFHIIQLIERRGEKIRTRHILIRVAPTEEDEERAIATLRELKQRILDGEDFEELALEYSDDENVAKDKGHLGVFETSKLVIPKFRDVLKDMEPGDVSDPFKTEFGYHIVKLNDRQKERTLTLTEDWQRIKEYANNMKMEREYSKWIEELKKNLSIQIRNPS